MRSQTDGRNMVEESILSLLKEIQPTPIRKFYECGLTEAGIRKYSKAYSLSREGLFSLPAPVHCPLVFSPTWTFNVYKKTFYSHEKAHWKLAHYMPTKLNF